MMIIRRQEEGRGCSFIHDPRHEVADDLQNSPDTKMFTVEFFRLDQTSLLAL
jgi:hypothetical protein